jgi:phage replication initiation protein
MTKVVLDWDGHEIDVRDQLNALRFITKSHVHVDWLRFTVFLCNAELPDLPPVTVQDVTEEVYGNVWSESAINVRNARFRRLLAEVEDADRTPAAQAAALAAEVCTALGREFSPATAFGKGYDFYKYRLPLMRNDIEVGWIGFLASSDSPRQDKQRNTLHVNLYGTACTFAKPHWCGEMANLIDQRQADITRCDLALDFFDGLPRGMDGVLDDYKAGLCDVEGRSLKCSLVGDWANGHERSFYLGSREAGKQTNIYEKGDQLYGVAASSPWVRIELRYGNKLRQLPSSILRRPADFFAGASEWHTTKLYEAEPGPQSPERVPCKGRLPLETVQAEVSRSLHWALRVAAPTISQLFQYLPDDEFLKVCDAHKKPGRLSSFSTDELRDAFGKISAPGAMGGYFPNAHEEGAQVFEHLNANQSKETYQ